MKTVGLLVAITVVFAAVLSCGEEPAAQPCTNVPPGGCPLSRGVACDDPSCEAVYRCLPGNRWELDHLCAGSDAGSSSKDASSADSSDGTPSRDAGVDAPPGAHGGPGCGALQVPDCALGTALLCGASCCGCEDLFVCENGGWTLWGSCGDAGPVPSR